MRKNIVAGNWKMNTTLQEGIELAKGLNGLLEKNDIGNVAVMVAPPFTHLSEVSKVIGKKIILAAQNCATELNGAYTGEISADMIKSAGAKAVIIGHSERRSYYGETGEILKKKINIAIEKGLTPIYCIGETLEDRKAEMHFNTVKKQLEESVFDLSAEDFSKLIIAYEPVWAIGTGLVATPGQAQEIHQFTRKTIAEKYGNEIADNISIIYGGSCKPSNANEIFSKADVDGGLIGGAALKAEDFFGIITAF